MDALRPRPATDDHDTGPFFDSLRRRELTVCRCAACSEIIHPPRGVCAVCRSAATTMEPVSGDATIYSWTVVEHQVHPAFDVPYTVVVVDLDDHPGVRFVGRLEGKPDLAAGLPMRVAFTELGDGVFRPDWQLVAGTH
ncbi:MAG: Zn-ribbon domain-containing OB-fold protein [Acidimicrobiia bacterium]